MKVKISIKINIKVKIKNTKNLALVKTKKLIKYF